MSVRDHSTSIDPESIGQKMSVVHAETSCTIDLTPEERELEKKLRRKIDSLIMPLVVLVYLLNYIDRYVATHHSPKHMYGDCADSLKKQ